ncbi:aldehyde dehydrogenase family protein [Nocardioides endophyticus]|uniref:Aldehyde dehydrogenase family protein n=1 Tax=Nocardioides endophyticus TaxID=1353775 RepID=A0ABP8ZCG9_9ACTN
MARTTVPDVKIRFADQELEEGSGGRYDHLHPFEGTLLSTFPLAGKEEVDLAVKAAKEASDGWRRWAPEARRDVLLRLADLIEEHRTEFAELAVLDCGTPFGPAQYIVDMALAWTRYYAGWADKISGELISTPDTRGALAYTMPQPIGVVGVIITWNGPMLSLGMKVPAALAAGNCVVVKPSEFTPYAADLYARLAREAGLPDGVLAMLPGAREAGDALVRHEDVELISFTGGPDAARHILAACADQMKPAVLELGGKSANIVFPDVEDLEDVLQRAVAGVIGTVSGQGCACPTRLVVHDDIFDEVVERVTAIAEGYRMGDPWDAETTVGPVINQGAADRIAAMLARAQQDGAGRITTGGGLAGGALAGKPFVEPTIVADPDPDSEISQVEIFGPVLLVNRFSDEEDAIAFANRTQYGLATYIETRDSQRIHRMAEQIRSSNVAVNGAYVLGPHMPYGGQGVSGYGKEGGRAGLDEYLRYKTVIVG